MKRIIFILVLIICCLTNYGQQTGNFKDPRDGKIYKTVQIGDQKWLAENLAFKTNSGCWAYQNDSNNIKKYGYLYNWDIADRGCPIGWQLPSDNDWSILKQELKKDSNGFPKLKGGYRLKDGTFEAIDSYGYWWSKSQKFKRIDTLFPDYYEYSEPSPGAWRDISIYPSDNLGLSILCLQKKN